MNQRIVLFVSSSTSIWNSHLGVLCSHLGYTEYYSISGVADLPSLPETVDFVFITANLPTTEIVRLPEHKQRRVWIFRNRFPVSEEAVARSFPKVIWGLIVPYLEVREVGQIATTEKSLYQLTRDGGYWQRRYSREMDHSFELKPTLTALRAYYQAVKTRKRWLREEPLRKELVESINKRRSFYEPNVEGDIDEEGNIEEEHEPIRQRVIEGLDFSHLDNLRFLLNLGINDNWEYDHDFLVEAALEHIILRGSPELVDCLITAFDLPEGKIVTWSTTPLKETLIAFRRFVGEYRLDRLTVYLIIRFLSNPLTVGAAFEQLRSFPKTVSSARHLLGLIHPKMDNIAVKHLVEYIIYHWNKNQTIRFRPQLEAVSIFQGLRIHFGDRLKVQKQEVIIRVEGSR